MCVHVFKIQDDPESRNSDFQIFGRLQIHAQLTKGNWDRQGYADHTNEKIFDAVLLLGAMRKRLVGPLNRA